LHGHSAARDAKARKAKVKIALLAQLDRAAHRVYHAAKLDDDPVASPFDDAAVAGGDCWVDEVAAQRPEPGESSLLVRSREPALANHIRD
jgi:hypothetical protein